MAVAIRGTSPATTASTSNPVSVTLNGTRQPATDDVLVIVHFNNFYAATNMPTPTVGGSTSGVAAITNGSADAGTNQAHVKTYTYVAASTGDLTVAVTETGSADEEKGLAVYVLTGVDTTTPVDVAGGSFSATQQTSHVLSAISPTSSDAFLLAHCHVGAGQGGAPYTVPGSMTQQYNSSVGGVMAYAGATEQLSASGSTGTRTFTPNPPDNVVWAGVLVAVKTATAGGGPTLMPRAVIVAG